MIATLTVTILTESIVALAYCIWRRKPIVPILLTSACANLMTQAVLWLVLNLFFQHYLIVLLITEISIWLVEGVALHVVSANRLGIQEAILLSLGINLVSTGLGWYLPI